MGGLLSFFALRPIFTFWGLKIVWYTYLFHTLVQLYISISEAAALMAQRGISWQTWVPNLFPLLLGIIAQIAIIRLLLEVAATILLTPRRSEA